MGKKNREYHEKEAGLELEGVVESNLTGDKFGVKLENGISIICTISGKIRLAGIKIVVGDPVRVVLSPYDLKQGRIVWRL